MGRSSRLRLEKRRAKQQSPIENQRQTNQIIHTSKLFGGRETAQEVHARLAWHGGRCQACSDPKVVIQISTHMLTRELIEKHPQIAARIMAASEDCTMPSWQSKYGRMTQVGIAYACETHRGAAERAAAHGPSNVLVEIDRGPGADKVIVQVPGGGKGEA